MKKLLASLLLTLGALAAHAATLTPIQLLNPAGSTSGQVIRSTGPGTAPAWSSITAANLATQAANTVLANVTASTASPTAFAMPSCSTSTSALQYTSGTGFTCYASSATTTGTLAQFAATTSAQLAGIVSDETGSGALVFGTSPTISSATITGSSYAGSVAATTLTASSTITPSQTAGIVGTTTNNNANAGSVGEFICAQVTNGGTPTGCATNTSTLVSLTSGTSANVTSITLTAGDWDVWGSINYSLGGSTAMTAILGAVSTTSATIPPAPNGGAVLIMAVPFTTGQGQGFPIGTTRISVASTTTVFLVTQAFFSTSTCAAGGFLGARRRR